MTHICISKLNSIGPDNGLSPGQHQAMIWINAGILLNGPLGTNFSQILIELYTFSFKKMYLKISSGKWQPFCLGFDVLSPALCWMQAWRMTWNIMNHFLSMNAGWNSYQKSSAIGKTEVNKWVKCVNITRLILQLANKHWQSHVWPITMSLFHHCSIVVPSYAGNSMQDVGLGVIIVTIDAMQLGLQYGPISIKRFFQYRIFIVKIGSMGWCKKDVTPLLMHWSYVFLALTHWDSHGTVLPL